MIGELLQLQRELLFSNETFSKAIPTIPSVSGNTFMSVNAALDVFSRICSALMWKQFVQFVSKLIVILEVLDETAGNVRDC